MFDLEGKRVMITAAGQGIGRGIAEGFVKAGARVHICDVDEGALAAVVASAPTIEGCVADVSIGTEVDRWFAQARDYLGGLDVIVNNAGIAGPTGPLESLPEAGWRKTLDVNVTGQFLCLRRAIPLLKATGGGSIVNIASTAGVLAYPLRTPYAASKWAVVGLTESLAMELGEFGIRVNAICPGSMEGERMERVIAAEAQARGLSVETVRNSYLKQTSLHTFIRPSDIANMILFICSAAGERISGQALSVDGHNDTLRCML